MRAEEVSNEMDVRTDLALESGERYTRDNVEISGVVIEKYRDADTGVFLTKVKIENEQGAEAMKKPVGTYLTVEDQSLLSVCEEGDEELSELLARQLELLICPKKIKSVLVVGLGNREVTPDALGPEVLGRLCITRHLVREYGEELQLNGSTVSISGIVPGVMAQTGMETLEIVKGIVEKTEPELVIVIDALAARSSKRLGCTIQIADTGIHPGSGVGNHRCGLNKETLGIPVIALGVPTVVNAASICLDFCRDKAEIPQELSGMFVTPKNIDEMIRNLGRILSDALNITFGVSI